MFHGDVEGAWDAPYAYFFCAQNSASVGCVLRTISPRTVALHLYLEAKHIKVERPVTRTAPSQIPLFRITASGGSSLLAFARDIFSKTETKLSWLILNTWFSQVKMFHQIIKGLPRITFLLAPSI